MGEEAARLQAKYDELRQASAALLKFCDLRAYDAIPKWARRQYDDLCTVLGDILEQEQEDG